MPPNATTLEQMLFAPVSRAPAAVAFISEVGYDTEYFDDRAYATLVASLSVYPGLTGIVLDGALTRLDRPEYLNEALTYWINVSVQEAKEEMARVPSYEHGANMLSKQLSILSQRLGELRQAMPQVQIVYSFHDDDLQHTVSVLMNQLMLAHKHALTSTIRNHQTEIEQRDEICRTAQETIDNLEGVAGSDAARDRKNAKRRLKSNQQAIINLNDQIEQVRLEQQYFRENKMRPLHQVVTRNFMTDLFARVQEICTEHQVILVTHDALLRFGSLTFLYGHSGHKTWGVIKKRKENLREGVQNIMRAFWEQPEALYPGAAGQSGVATLHTVLRESGIDAVVESGHSGGPFTSVQKCAVLSEEINFKNAGLFDGTVSDQYVRVVSVMPFESRQKLGAYVHGQQAVRLSGGKPGGSRSSRAVERYHASVPAGLTILTKGESERTGVQWIKYADFINGVGILPTKHVIASSSDEHVGGPFWLPLILEGWINFLTELTQTKEGFPFLTQKSHLAGMILPGDQIDANTSGWPYGKEKMSYNPMQVQQDSLHQLLALEPNDPESLAKLIGYMTSLAGGGSVESMRDILDWATDYMWRVLTTLLPETMLQFVLVRIPGNHTGSALARLGMNSNCFLEQRLKVAEIPYFLVGRPEFIAPAERETARVFLGGFGISLVGAIENYGRAIDGSYLFGPIRLSINHNPKGPEMSGLVSAGRGTRADVVVAGHTHEFYVVPYLSGNDQVGFAVRVPTLEGVTDVELYYAGDLLRVQGALLMSMPGPGQFAEEFVFVHKLRQVGQKLLLARITTAIRNK